MANREILLEKIKNRPSEWREGQAAWNYAVEVYGNDVVGILRGTVFDPFHNDLKTELFLNELEIRDNSKSRKSYPRESDDPLITIPMSTFNRLLTSEDILRKIQSQPTVDEHRFKAILFQYLAKIAKSGFAEEAKKIGDAVDSYTQFMRNIDRTLIMKAGEPRPLAPPQVVAAKNKK